MIEKFLWAIEAIIIVFFFLAEFSYELFLFAIVIFVFAKNFNHLVCSLKYKNYFFSDYVTPAFFITFAIGILSPILPVIAVFDRLQIELNEIVAFLIISIFILAMIWNIFWLIARAMPIFLWRFALVKDENSLKLVSRFPQRNFVNIDFSKKHERIFAYKQVRDYRNQMQRVNYIVYIQNGQALAVETNKHSKSACNLARMFDENKKVQELYEISYSSFEERRILKNL